MSTRSPSSRRHSASWMLIGSARRRSRPGRSTRTSGAGTPRSSPSDDRGTTNRVRGWNWSPCSMPSGRTGWSPTSSSTRRCPTGSTSRVRTSGMPADPRTLLAGSGHPASPSRRSTRLRHSPCTGTPWTSTGRWPFCATSTPGSWPSTPISLRRAMPPASVCRPSCTRGSRDWTTRRSGIAPWRGWSSLPARCRRTNDSTSGTRTPRTGPRMPRTTDSSGHRGELVG